MLAIWYFLASDVPTGKVTPDIEEKASKFEEFRPQTPDLSKTLDDEELENVGGSAEHEPRTESVKAKTSEYQVLNSINNQETADETDRVLVTKRDERPAVSLEDLKQMIAEKKRSYFDGSSDSNCGYSCYQKEPYILLLRKFVLV